MRTDLEHLPGRKRRDLERIVRVLFEEFEAATANRSQNHLRKGRILKVVLFGSHARGGWVADRVGGYFSDYDLLVVVDHDDLADVVDYWSKAEDRLLEEESITKRFSAPVDFIVHSLQYVNSELSRGRPFFVDILKDGIALYEAKDHPFAEPGPLTPEDALAEAESYFQEWFETATQYLRQAQHAVDDGAPKIAAFDLHQAAERLYHCTLLVLTLYSPKLHNLNKLRPRAERLAPELIEAWPRARRLERRTFQLLRRAYVEARYSRHYKITPEELAWLRGRIEVLRDKVRMACERRLAEMRCRRG